MTRLIMTVFSTAFIALVAGLSVAPSFVLSGYRDGVATVSGKPGVDPSVCGGAAPKLGIESDVCQADL